MAKWGGVTRSKRGGWQIRLDRNIWDNQNIKTCTKSKQNFNFRYFLDYSQKANKNTKFLTSVRICFWRLKNSKTRFSKSWIKFEKIAKNGGFQVISYLIFAENLVFEVIFDLDKGSAGNHLPTFTNISFKLGFDTVNNLPNVRILQFSGAFKIRFFHASFSPSKVASVPFISNVGGFSKNPKNRSLSSFERRPSDDKLPKFDWINCLNNSTPEIGIEIGTRRTIAARHDAFNG